jgi:hypothetical protein
MGDAERKEEEEIYWMCLNGKWDKLKTIVSKNLSLATERFRYISTSILAWAISSDRLDFVSFVHDAILGRKQIDPFCELDVNLSVRDVGYAKSLPMLVFLFDHVSDTTSFYRKDMQGDTAAHYYAQDMSIDLLSYLTRHAPEQTSGNDPLAVRNKRGKTPLNLLLGRLLYEDDFPEEAIMFKHRALESRSCSSCCWRLRADCCDQP